MNNSIEALHANDIVSGETYLFCIENNLQSIEDVAGSLANDTIVCNQRVRSEIEHVIKQYHKPVQPQSTEEKQTPSHYENAYLRLKTEYAVRTQNALNHLESWLGYPSDAFWTFLLHNPNRDSDFKHIRNVGRKTIDELRDLANRLIGTSGSDINLDTAQVIPTQETPSCDITELEDKVLTLYQFAIEQEMVKLSARAKNALDRLYIDHNRSIVELYQTLHAHDSNPLKIKNVGKGSAREILGFAKTMDDILTEYLSTDGTLKTAQIIKIDSLQRSFGLTELEAQVIVEESPDLMTLPLFRAIDLLLKRDYRDWAITAGSINIFREQTLIDRKIIARELGLSPERVRQLRNEIYKKIVATISKWNKAEGEDFCHYTDYCHLEYNDQHLDELNELEKTNFNTNFIYRVLSLLFPNSYTITGDDFASFVEPYNKGGNINIVPVELSKIFDFNNMIDDLRSKLDAKVYENYSIEIGEYLLRFFRDDILFEQLPSLIEICSKIIHRNFGIVVIDNVIKIERNATRAIPEIVEDIIAEYGKAMSLDEIYDQLEVRHPGLTKDKDALRGSITRNNNVVPVGRSSNYVLKAWEKDGIKGGTIRDIVFDLLMDKGCPLAMGEIADHVLLYREGTNAQSIYYNLFADKSKRFSTFDLDGERLIGLSHIKYGDQYELIDGDGQAPRRDFHQSISLLEQFIIKNDRFPFSSSEDPEEMRLNRFWGLHKSRRDKGELSPEQLTEMDRIEEEYGDKEISKLNFIWDQKYKSLIEFIDTYGRLPIRSTEYELYNWLYNQRIMVEEGKLDSDQVLKIMQLN